MASGRTHAKIAGWVLVLAGGASALTLSSLSVPFTLGLLNGFLVTPDIDIQATTHEERRWKNFPLFGPIFFLLFSVFWYLYSLLFSHRGISHIHIVGTLTRFCYQVGMLLPLLLLTPLTSGLWMWAQTSEGAIFIGCWIAGQSLQDSIHIITDGGRKGRRSAGARRRRWKGVGPSQRW